MGKSISPPPDMFGSKECSPVIIPVEESPPIPAIF